jgi:hypothetical protein
MSAAALRVVLAARRRAAFPSRTAAGLRLACDRVEFDEPGRSGIRDLPYRSPKGQTRKSLRATGKSASPSGTDIVYRTLSGPICASRRHSAPSLIIDIRP